MYQSRVENYEILYLIRLLQGRAFSTRPPCKGLIFTGFYKTFTIMAKVKLIFYGTEGHTVDHELQCYCNADGEIYISIDTKDIQPSWICLDKSTAIKLAKTLRTEINKIEGGSNG